jgi:hypothetical protein
MELVWQRFSVVAEAFTITSPCYPRNRPSKSLPGGGKNKVHRHQVGKMWGILAIEKRQSIEKTND